MISSLSSTKRVREREREEEMFNSHWRSRSDNNRMIEICWVICVPSTDSETISTQSLNRYPFINLDLVLPDLRKKSQIGLIRFLFDVILFSNLFWTMMMDIRIYKTKWNDTEKVFLMIMADDDLCWWSMKKNQNF